ncbi:MAG: PQQ-binding-like beta-propeller repeat protein [bacterium]|nr:PQQ-binding-like beta-propeller repeat protein [bacterium]
MHFVFHLSVKKPWHNAFRCKRLWSVGVCMFALVHAGMAHGTDVTFPQFRGSGGRAAVEDQPIPLQWDANNQLAWRASGIGSGWSQPIVVGNRVFITAATSDKPLAPKNFADGVRTPQSMGLGFLSTSPKLQITWLVKCLDLGSGQLLWTTEIEQGKPEFGIHPSNTYATETPVADAERVYVYFGASGSVAALTHAGEKIWTRQFSPQKTSNNFGTGSSLAIRAGKVFVQNFGEDRAELICLDGSTGETLWTQSREKPETSWSSPIVWNNHVRDELIVSGGNQVSSYAPDSGEVLWTVSNVKAPTACSVAMDQQQIYFGGSDPFSTGPLFAVSAGAAGDLTPKKKNSAFEYCRWVTDRAAPGMASPVSTGTLVYVPDKNILRCYRAESGELVYQQRLPDIKMVNASPILIGDKLLLVGEEGNCCLVQTGEEFQIVGGGRVDDTVWATPAVAGGRILIRGLDTIYCFGGN